MAKQQAFEILEPFLVGKEQANGDWDMKCPLHHDKKRSGRVNFREGVWICFRGCGQGRLSGLVRRMREEAANPSAEASGKRRGQEKPKKATASIQIGQAERWHHALMADRHAMEYLWRVRAVDEESMRQFGIGYDRARQAFTIPIFNADGSLFNVRKYRPNAPSDSKIFWAVPTNGPIPLFGMNVVGDSSWVVICEGEMDAILANQFGFPAVSGTAGASVWHLTWLVSVVTDDHVTVLQRIRPGEMPY